MLRAVVDSNAPKHGSRTVTKDSQSDEQVSLISSLERNQRLSAALFEHSRLHGEGAVLALQNDADEFVSSRVLGHLQVCDLKRGVDLRKGLYAPCFAFKNNFNWLQVSLKLQRSYRGGYFSILVVSCFM